MMESEFDGYKNLIPDFIFKLYHILEVTPIMRQKKQYRDYITWANDGTEILIKSAKKLEDRVLPNFFRHKHISSFIRQLNMYKFSKVNKISKERNHMYFRNEHFQRGQFNIMRKIKRNQKGKKYEEKSNFSVESSSNPNKSIKIQPQSNPMQFNKDAKYRFNQLQIILKEIIKKNPQLMKELVPALELCQKSMESISEEDHPPHYNLDEQVKEEENIMGAIRDFPLVPLAYPSNSSLNKFQ